MSKAKAKATTKAPNNPFIEMNPLVSFKQSDTAIANAVSETIKGHDELLLRALSNSQQSEQEDFSRRDVLPILTEPLLGKIRIQITSCVNLLFPDGLIRTYFDSPNVIQRIIDAFRLFGCYHFDITTPDDEIENVVRFVCLYVGLTILTPEQNKTELGLNELTGRFDPVKVTINIPYIMGGEVLVTLVRHEDNIGARNLCYFYNGLIETYDLNEEQLKGLLVVDVSIAPNEADIALINEPKYVVLLPNRDNFVKALDLHEGDAGIFAHYTGGAAYLGCLSSAIAIFWSLKEKRKNIMSRKENWEELHRVSKEFEAVIATTKQNLVDHNLDTMSTLFNPALLVGPEEIIINGECLTNFCIKLLINSENGITLEESKELLGLYVSRVLFHSASELTKEHVFNDKYTQESQREVDVAIKTRNKARESLKSADRLSVHAELLQIIGVPTSNNVKLCIQNWKRLLLSHPRFKDVFDDIPELVEIPKKRARPNAPPFTVVPYSTPISISMGIIKKARTDKDMETFHIEQKKLISLLIPYIREVIKEVSDIKNIPMIQHALLKKLSHSSSFPHNEGRYISLLLADIVKACLTVLPEGSKASEVSINNVHSPLLLPEIKTYNIFPSILSKDNLRQTAAFTKKFLEAKLLETNKLLEEYKQFKKTYNEANKEKLSPNITQKYSGVTEYIGILEEKVKKFNKEIVELTQLNALNITNDVLTENGIARLTELNLDYNLSNYSLSESGNIYSNIESQMPPLNTTQTTLTRAPVYAFAQGYKNPSLPPFARSAQEQFNAKNEASKRASNQRKAGVKNTPANNNPAKKSKPTKKFNPKSNNAAANNGFEQKSKKSRVTSSNTSISNKPAANNGSKKKVKRVD